MSPHSNLCSPHSKMRPHQPALDGFSLGGGPVLPEGQQPQQVVEDGGEGWRTELSACDSEEAAQPESHERGVGPGRERRAALEKAAPNRKLATTFVCVCSQPRKKSSSAIDAGPVSGGAPSRLTTAPSEDLVPRWSRDGRWVYVSSNRTGGWEAWRTRAAADPHRVQQVTTGGAVAAQESRTDLALYCVRPDTMGSWRVPPESFPLTDIPELPTSPILQFDPQERGS
jgi:hypothetical protein